MINATTPWLSPRICIMPSWKTRRRARIGKGFPTMIKPDGGMSQNRPFLLSQSMLPMTSGCIWTLKHPWLPAGKMALLGRGRHRWRHPWRLGNVPLRLRPFRGRDAGKDGGMQRRLLPSAGTGAYLLQSGPAGNGCSAHRANHQEIRPCVSSPKYRRVSWILPRLPPCLPAS